MDETAHSENSPGGDREATVSLDVLPLHSTNLLTVLNEEGIIQYESPSIERIYGFDQDELVGEQVAEYFHPEDRETVLDAFQTIVTSAEYTVEAVEYRHLTADGDYVWVESIASADPTPEGHYVVNTRDISERKERERALEATNERLEALTNVVSHDLRNPLNVAEANLELIREERDGDRLAAVARAHDRMETLIEDLLTLSQVQREIGETESVRLGKLCADCWETVDTAEGTLDVRTEQTVRAHRSRLRQVLENLFRNAIEHAGPETTVTVGPLESGFYVEDDGPGVPESARPKVFETGYTTADEGTGFGLGIVSEIADAHGWTLTLTDGPDGGARFEFSAIDRID